MSAERYPAASRGELVLWGLLGRAPYGGMTWQVLHHLVGLRRLGWDVWYVEDSDALPLHPVTRERTADPKDNIEFLRAQLAAVGLADRWAYRIPRTSEVVGNLDCGGLRRLYRRADVVLNLCGGQELLPHHRETTRLVYLETDPVVNQVEVARNDDARIRELDSYAHHFTYATGFGSDECRVPLMRYEWHPTLPPVVVDWWASASEPRNDAFTTVANWKHTSKDITWNGESWSWSKHSRFLQLIDLPAHTRVPLEIAVVGAGEDIEMLARHGWRTRSAWSLSDPQDYRSFVRESRGEFSVAKEQYVVPRTGWFSDRSVCYLAAGRPTVLEDTGFSRSLPTGAGLMGFTDVDGAADAIERIASDYPAHAAAATEIAREHFGADRVLGPMLEIVMSS